jgi:hypothetical protein
VGGQIHESMDAAAAADSDHDHHVDACHL